MMASLMVGNRKIKHGDGMDIEHISTMLPYVDLMIVDDAMKHLINELDLANPYRSICFSLRDDFEIINWLDHLEHA